MAPELKGYILSVVYGIMCLLLAVVLHKLGVSKRYCRKAVHILVGFEWLILYVFMGASIHFFVVCIAFLILMGAIYFKNFLPMISSDGDNAPGTVYYCVAMSIMALICIFEPDMMLPFGIGVFCTSFGDGFAGLAGQSIKKYNPKIFRNKSLFGIIANFAFSFGTAIAFKYLFDMDLAIWHCILIAIFSVQLELLGIFGLDNIFITLGTAFLAYGFVFFEGINSYLAPIILTPLVILVVVKKKALTTCGLIFALVLDLVVSLTLANFGFVLLLTFLFASIVIDKIKKIAKRADGITKKGECRDEIQVLANGLIPMMLAVIYSCTFNPVFVVAYVAVLAEAFADTAASGFGVFAKKTFDPFKMKVCECGLSGGMSVIGTVASLLAAAVFSLLVLPFGIKSFSVIFTVIIAAFLGVVFDSLLGSLVQVKYKCAECNSLTEREWHCEKPTKQVSGFRFFDNDVVNVTSATFSAVISVLSFSLIG